MKLARVNTISTGRRLIVAVMVSDRIENGQVTEDNVCIESDEDSAGMYSYSLNHEVSNPEWLGNYDAFVSRPEIAPYYKASAIHLTQCPKTLTMVRMLDMMARESAPITRESFETYREIAANEDVACFSALKKLVDIKG